MSEGQGGSRPMLQGRHALVTGGGRGIGRAIAGTLAAAGAHVVVLGRSGGHLEDAVAAGLAHAAIVADVTDAAGLASALAGMPPVDILVANAGAAVSAPLARTDDALFARMIEINLMGVVRCARSVLPGMSARGFGRIVAVASTAGLKGYPYVSAYAAAKHALVGYVRSAALELARSGITVNAVCPGFAQTDLVEESLERIVAKTGRTRDEARAELTKHNPQGRLIDPAEVADAVLWLCGDGARSVTGQAVAIAGGEV